MMRDTATESDARSFSGGRRRPCRQYAVLVDDGRPGEAMSLCAGSARISDVYLSTGNTLQVRITAGLAPNDFQRFVIAYTGKFTVSRMMMMTARFTTS